jgi:ribosomal protein L16 Arg81 hydroxylase
VRGASGIDWHFDPEDVIHFQIKGDKLFKLLRTSNTCFADGQTKRFERIMADQQSFGEASEQLVEAGTITVIPRGVWHWSEGKSDESFAVSLCVNPLSCGQTLMEALSNRLRLMERSRMPLFGDTGSQRQALEACIKEAGALLEAMNSEDVLLQEYRRVLPVDNIDSFYFHLGKRANARLDPLRMLVDGQEIAMEKGEDQAAVLEAVCRIGDGFRSWELKELLPRVDPDLVNGVLASLVKIGFVDFIDGNLDPRL